MKLCSLNLYSDNITIFTSVYDEVLNAKAEEITKDDFFNYLND